MMRFILLIVAIIAQKICHQKAENNPPLTTKYCTTNGGCTQEQNAVTIDANWRWTHTPGTTNNCYKGNEWDKSICTDGPSCAFNCGVDGADYPNTYGVEASGADLNLKFVTTDQYGTNIGSRLYLTENNGAQYKMFKLLNKEFTFDVDVSNLPCGLNGALYFVEMDKDGGTSKYSGDKAGAKYGTGYCDAQCPHDIKWINGEGNVKDWQPSSKDKNAGTGFYGTCCAEMDIWEANSQSTQLTPHSCSCKGQTRCSGIDCGDNASNQRNDGICDKDGCDFNPYRLGQHMFYGPNSSYTIDTSKPFTVVTQFITTDGTDSGDLKEIRRKYVQNGKVIDNPSVTFGVQKFNSITDEFCNEKINAFGEVDSFEKRKGLKNMGEALGRGVVLVMSLWDDHAVNMLWLDSDYPPDKTGPGVARGPCPTSSGKPEDVERDHPDANVKYFNIKWGEIGSTFNQGGNCPGGSLAACIGLCPSNPAKVYQACVQSCMTRCSTKIQK